MLRSIPLQFEPHTRNYGIGIRNRCSADSSHQRCSFHHALGWESFIRHSFFLLNHFSSFEEIVAALAREVNAKENENRGRKSAAPTKPRLFHCAPEQLFGGVMGLPQARSTGISESLNRGSLLFLLCCVSFVQRTTVVYFYRRPPPPLPPPSGPAVARYLADNHRVLGFPRVAFDDLLRVHQVTGPPRQGGGVTQSI